MQTRGRFFDGLTAAQHEVRVTLSEERFVLAIEGETLAEPLEWALGDLRATGDHAETRQMVLTRHLDTDDEAPRDPARLILDDPDAIAWLRASRPNLHKADLRSGTGRRIARNAALALGAVGVMLFVILPSMANTLATIIPLEREIAFGKSVTGQMERFLGGSELGALHCEGPEGRAALDAMAERLTAGRELDYELDILVFDHEMVNAFAAPGGQIVLLRGLLDESRDADAVAGVLAHEIGHVVNRDPTRVALRTVGSAGLLSLVIGDVTGGAIMVALSEQALNSSYSREAEEQADAYALAMLDDADVSAQGFAAFFEQIKEMQGDFEIPEYLASHPDTDGRAAQAEAFAARQGETSPVLSPAEWKALQGICG